jgi:hypothetical protein
VSVPRNDPCPCGSGKKYKKCCGSVIALQPVETAARGSQKGAPLAASRRSCGTCTACCDGWMAGDIFGHEMKEGQPCFFRGEQCCTIYERRPESPCRTFICGWLQRDSPFPEDFRPDRLGVLIAPIRWRGQAAYILRSAGRDPDEALLEWMQAFSERSGSPFFYEVAGERFGFGPMEFQLEMQQKLQRGEKLW